MGVGIGSCVGSSGKTGSTSSSQPESILSSEMCPILILVYISSGLHGILGVMSIILGVLATQGAEVWMAHRVSPIWSGVFYILTAVLGVTTAKKRTAYLVMCLGALCVVSMVVGVVCIQLLKLGLVTQLSDGDTYRQDTLDVKVILAMATSGLEMLVCVLTFPICCKMAAKVKAEIHMKRDGTFSVLVLGEKEIIIQQTDSTSYERLCEDDTVSDLARATKIEHSELLLATMGIAHQQKSGKDTTPKSKKKLTGYGSNSSKKPKKSESTTPLVSSKTKDSMMSSSTSSPGEEKTTLSLDKQNPKGKKTPVIASVAEAVLRKSNGGKKQESVHKRDQLRVEEGVRLSDYDNLDSSDTHLDNLSGIV